MAATVWPAGGAGFGELLGPVFSQPNVVPLQDQSLPPALDFARRPDGLARVFTDAGLHDVTSRAITWKWRVSPGALWAGISAGVATPGLTYLAQTSEVRAQLEREFFEKAASMTRDGFLTFMARGVIAAGRAR